MTIAELRLATSGLAPADFTLLLEAATGHSRAFLLAHPEYLLPPSALKRAKNFIKRRQEHEPLAYITGRKEFYGREFLVSKATLIPRPETEHLIEEVLTSASQDAALSTAIVDIGTGSGNIILTLAQELAQSRHQYAFLASDLSPGALRIAKKNARLMNVAERVSFLSGDLLMPYVKKNILHEPRIIIAANLPYVSEKIFMQSSRDVRDFEPLTALVSPEAGLAHYFRLLDQTKEYFSQKNILLFLEISPEQKSKLTRCFCRLFPKGNIRFCRDLAGRDRVAVATINA